MMSEVMVVIGILCHWKSCGSFVDCYLPPFTIGSNSLSSVGSSVVWSVEIRTRSS